jgi:hypothetical protein
MKGDRLLDWAQEDVNHRRRVYAGLAQRWPAPVGDRQRGIPANSNS